MFASSMNRSVGALEMMMMMMIENKTPNESGARTLEQNNEEFLVVGEKCKAALKLRSAKTRLLYPRILGRQGPNIRTVRGTLS